MSLFGTSPPNDSPSVTSSMRASRSLFDDEPAAKESSGGTLFANDDPAGADSPWAMPTPRKQQSRADLVRNLLPAADVPDSYIEAFDTVVREYGIGGRVDANGLAKVFAAARLGREEQARVMEIVAPGGEVAIGRGEFNVLLALVGLAQEGETVSLDDVDERRKSKSPSPDFPPLIFFLSGTLVRDTVPSKSRNWLLLTHRIDSPPPCGVSQLMTNLRPPPAEAPRPHLCTGDAPRR